jgi:hypothetical protein
MHGCQTITTRKGGECSDDTNAATSYSNITGEKAQVTATVKYCYKK